LEDPQRMFELYVSPPKRTLENSVRSLGQEQLLGASIVNIKFHDDRKGPYINESLLGKIEVMEMPSLESTAYPEPFLNEVLTNTMDSREGIGSESQPPLANSMMSQRDEHASSSNHSDSPVPNSKSPFPKWWKPPK
jgi:hypothetical protein